jgi:hypothetical protein
VDLLSARGPGSTRLAALIGSGLVAGAGPARLAATQIEVGPTVPISIDAGRDEHGESVLAINPRNPRNLLAATNVVRQGGAFGTSAYVSHDGGATWRRVTAPAQAYRIADGWDVIAYFDSEGNAYWGSMYYGPAHKVNYGAGLWLTRSTDQGQSWSEATHIPATRLFDRPYLGFDPGGKYAGRIYAGGVVGATGFDNARHGALVVAYSTDSARTFGQPHLVVSPPDEESGVFANLMVTPGGKLVAPFVTTRPSEGSPRQPPRAAALRVLTSADGGETYRASPPVLRFSARVLGMPAAVLDGSDGPYRGRIHLVWAESAGQGNTIRATHSDDDGASWSPPVAVSDTGKPGAHVTPAVAVDRQGIVGVSWYDRRGRADQCFRLRFTASLDGGDAFLPDAAQGGKPTCTRLIPDGGETQGLVGDAGGRFYSAWIDGSSGVPQLSFTGWVVRGAVRPRPER